MAPRNKRRTQLLATRKALLLSQTIHQPVLPVIRTRRDPAEILHCNEDELPGLVQAWTEYASGLVKTRETCEELRPKQQKIVEHTLQRLLMIRYPGSIVPLKPKSIQVDVLERLVFGRKDVLLVVKTGSGKSLVFQGWTMLTGKTAIVIVPLNGLGDQIHGDLQSIPGAKPIILSSETKLANPDILFDIEHGRHTHIITSPEQAVDPRFCELLRRPEFASTIGLLVIDEAHCIAMWSTFRSEYAKLGILRDILPSQVGLFACSATLPERLEQRIVKDAGFNRNGTWDRAVNLIRGSVDRPEISIIVETLPRTKPMQRLLSILQPAIDGVQDVARRTSLPLIEQTVVFANTRNKVSEICKLLRATLLDAGYSMRVVCSAITTYTSRTAKRDRDIRRDAMQKENPRLLVLVATTAFGMGLDIPKIKNVYQYGAVLIDVNNQNAYHLIPCDVMQRGGRAVRKGGVQGRFMIMLEHDVAVKEKILHEKMLQVREKSEKRDQPHKTYRGSKQRATTTQSRRNSMTAESSGRYSEVPARNDSPAGSVDELIDVDMDTTFDGISAAVDALRAVENDQRITDTGSRFFSWTTLVQSTECYRAHFLAFLGEDLCRPDQKGIRPSRVVCCSRCNPALIPEVWDLPDSQDLNRTVRAPKKGEDAWFVLDCIQEWLQEEVHRIMAGDGKLTRINVRLPISVFFPMEIQYRIARSVFSTDRFQSNPLFEIGPRHFSEAIKAVEYPTGGMFNRFRRFIMSKREALRTMITEAVETQRSRREESFSAVQENTSSQTCSSRIEASSRELEALSSQIAVSTQNSGMCMDVLRANLERSHQQRPSLGPLSEFQLPLQATNIELPSFGGPDSNIEEQDMPFPQVIDTDVDTGQNTDQEKDIADEVGYYYC